MLPTVPGRAFFVYVPLVPRCGASDGDTHVKSVHLCDQQGHQRGRESWKQALTGIPLEYVQREDALHDLECLPRFWASAPLVPSRLSSIPPEARAPLGGVGVMRLRSIGVLSRVGVDDAGLRTQSLYPLRVFQRVEERSCLQKTLPSTPKHR